MCRLAAGTADGSLEPGVPPTADGSVRRAVSSDTAHSTAGVR